MSIGIWFDEAERVNTFHEIKHIHEAKHQNEYAVRDLAANAELIDKTFYKGAGKNTKVIQGAYLAKLMDEEMEEYYSLFYINAKKDTVTERIRYYKNYFKLSPPRGYKNEAPSVGNHFQTKISGLEFSNVPIREIVPAPYPYDKVENIRYLHVHTLGGRTYPVQQNKMYSFNYDKTPTNVDQFEPLPKWKVNRKKINLIRKEFYAKTVDKITSMYKLLPDQLTPEDRRGLMNEYKTLSPEDDYAMFLLASYRVNDGHFGVQSKKPVEKVIAYLEDIMKTSKCNQILERV